MRAAVVDLATNIVVNIAVADPSVDPAPDGFLFVGVDEVPCGMGWIYEPLTGGFTDPNPPPPDEEGEA